MNPAAVAVVFFLGTLACSRALLAQGSLTPPGPPAPVMKTLDQVEARTPIDQAHTPGDNFNLFVITQPGSYYLTRNYTVNTHHGIAVASHHVTLDLNGFTLTASAASQGSAVTLLGVENVTVKNGHIQGITTVNGTAFSGGGFTAGVTGIGANVHVRDISVSGINGAGIHFANTVNSSATSCTTNVTKGDGIRAASVTDCTAQKAGAYGIYGSNVTNSNGESIAGGTLFSGVYAAVANNCTGTGTSARGVDAANAMNCRGTSVSGVGLNARDAATNCTGVSTSDTGLFARKAATGSSGTSTSGGGLFADNATNCHGTSNTGQGLVAVTASNCYGVSSIPAAAAFNATKIASYCWGQNNGSGIGLSATIAVACAGASVSGTSVVVTHKFLMP